MSLNSFIIGRLVVLICKWTCMLSNIVQVLPIYIVNTEGWKVVGVRRLSYQLALERLAAAEVTIVTISSWDILSS